MVPRPWLVLAVMTLGCGRIGFDDVNPAFDLDLTRGELGSVQLTRPSPASYVDGNGVLQFAAANEPRFDHDPITHAPRGLLIESRSTNQLTHSEELDVDSGWFTNGTVAVRADQAIAPDGTLSADEVADNDTNVFARRAHFVPIPDDRLSYSYSVYVRSGTSPRFTFAAELLQGTQQIQVSMSVDLVTGTILSPPAGNIPFGIERHANGWHRVWIILTNNGTGNIEGILSVWGDRDAPLNTGTLFAWGAQLEQTSHPSSYIRTTDSELTREADVALERDVSWLVPDRGTLRTRASVGTERGLPTPTACLLAASTPRVCVEASAVAAVAWDDQGSSRVDPASGLVTGLPPPAADTDALSLGSDGSRFLDGHLERVTYWPRRFSDAELRQLP